MDSESITICEHSLNTGVPIPIEPGQNHACQFTCQGNCHCEPLSISIPSFKHQKQYTYDWETETSKIRPLGHYNYAAKVSFMNRKQRGGMPVQVNPKIGEVWGTTSEDANNKLRDAVRLWIIAQT